MKLYGEPEKLTLEEMAERLVLHLRSCGFAKMDVTTNDAMRLIRQTLHEAVARAEELK